MKHLTHFRYSERRINRFLTMKIVFYKQTEDCEQIHSTDRDKHKLEALMYAKSAAGLLKSYTPKNY